jgi:phosphoribosyl 1,2-cyclic phosphodiesterase
MALSALVEMDLFPAGNGDHPGGDSLSITVLGSGSSGNAILIRNPRTAFLIDAGLSAKRLCAALEAQRVQPGDLAGIALTHEHGDHTGGLRTFCKRWTVPLFATRMTAEAVCFSSKVGQASWRYFSSGQSFSIADVPVGAFSVPHDAADPVGFLVGPPHRRAAILTDLGMVTRSVVEVIRGVRVLCLETNYDEELLEMDTKRPWAVKQRISARHGHLSNRAAAELVREVAGPALHTVILGHLSEDCNHPDLAIRTVKNALLEAGCPETRVVCAPRNEAMETVAV